MFKTSKASKKESECKLLLMEDFFLVMTLRNGGFSPLVWETALCGNLSKSAADPLNEEFDFMDLGGNTEIAFLTIPKLFLCFYPLDYFSDICTSVGL